MQIGDSYPWGGGKENVRDGRRRLPLEEERKDQISFTFGSPDVRMAVVHTSKAAHMTCGVFFIVKYIQYKN